MPNRARCGGVGVEGSRAGSAERTRRQLHRDEDAGPSASFFFLCFCFCFLNQGGRALAGWAVWLTAWLGWRR